MKKPDPSDITGISEVEILNQLRSAPELLQIILDSSEKETKLQERLRTSYPPELVRSALRLLDIRRRAQGVLPQADSLWLTRQGFEQATPIDVAQHKATRFPPKIEVFDLCSGIGVDTNALVQRGPVTSVDSDEATLLRNQWNIDVWNPGATPSVVRHLCQDVRKLDLSNAVLHIDPDRRAGRDRPTKRLELYQPNLEWMQRLVRTAAGGAIKLGPASNFIQKFPGCEIELVSLNGECKEATVWFGRLAGQFEFRATLLPSGETMSGDSLTAYCPVGQLAEFVFDPDPSVVRSGLLEQLGEIHNLHRLDKADEYLTGDQIPDSGFVSAFRVEHVLGNNPKDLKRYLRSNPGSHYEIKCRHLKVDANELQRKLPRGGGPPRVIFFLRIDGRAKVVVSERIQKHQDCR